MKTKITTLEVLRGTAALLVVLFHTQDIFVNRANIIPFDGLFGAGDRGVDLFFVLSGFIIVTSHRDDIGRAERTKRYVYRRACRLLPSVWIMSLIAVVVYGQDFGGAGKIGKLDPWNVAASFLLLPQHGPALVNVTWTLKYEAIFYSLFAIVIVSRWAGGLLVAAWQFGALLAWAGIIDWQASLPFYYFRPICLEFAIGMSCAFLYSRREPASGRMHTHFYIALLALATAVFAGSMVYEGIVVPHGLEQVRVLAYGLPAGIIIFAAARLERDGRLRAAPLLCWPGEASYAIYLVHYSVITLSVALLLKFSLLPASSTAAAICALLGVAAGTGFHVLVDRPIQTLLRRLGSAGLVPERVLPAFSWGAVARAKAREPLQGRARSGGARQDHCDTSREGPGLWRYPGSPHRPR